MSVSRSAVVPRIRFETVTKEVTDALPRMDVAVFVGFAAAGPLHVPVAIENVNQFNLYFGEKQKLAWDAEEGTILYAHLAPSVAAFFANGGRRCWVIRVASNQASYNYYPVPCLLKCVLGDKGKTAKQQPAFVRSSSEGSWSDTIKLSAAQRVRALPVVSYSIATSVLTLDQDHGLRDTYFPEVGSLVRLRFDAAGSPISSQFCLYAQAIALTDDPLTPTFKKYRLVNESWFADEPAKILRSGLLDIKIKVGVFKAADVPRPQYYFAADDPYAEPPSVTEFTEIDARMTCTSAGKAQLHIGLDEPINEQIVPGVLVLIMVENQKAWFVVDERKLRYMHTEDTSPSVTEWIVDISGQLYWVFAGKPATLIETALQGGEVLSLDLETQHDTLGVHRLHNIGLTNDHDRFLCDVPVDQARFRPKPGKPAGVLANEARALAFPLATADPPCSDTALVFIPLGLPSVMTASNHAIAQNRTALERDGLDSYDPSLFLDPDLTEGTTHTLMAEADYSRYLAPKPRPLCGLHAALGFGESRITDEVTLIAVPDAVHRGWTKPKPESVSVNLLATVDREMTTIVEFQDCAQTILLTPHLTAGLRAVDSTYFSLEWDGVSGVTYVVEEATNTDFKSATTVYAGTDHKIELTRPEGGRHYFRVRAVSGAQASNWSNGVVIILPSPMTCAVTPVSDYQSKLLNTVHAALLRLAAAQGELFSVLSMPWHFRETEMRNYYSQLSVNFAQEIISSPLSYGALYHPWLQSRSERGDIVTIPPDGAVLGIFAARAVKRGAWVAPANERLTSILAITPPIRSNDDMAINVISNTPEGFLCWRADTLEVRNPDLRLINVRRLLILLRRLALRHGATYAFEPNGGVLRRLVQRRFESLLRAMYDRGAFSGDRPDQAYQVDTGPEFNTAQSVDSGKLIVALRVSPSVPMEFISVRLVQHGDQLSIAEGR